jgi:50S ribosome-binding GTPase
MCSVLNQSWQTCGNVHVCMTFMYLLSHGCVRQGYTNAGKSSLIEALTGADLGAEDALFATLDATARVSHRHLRLQSGRLNAYTGQSGQCAQVRVWLLRPCRP